MASLLFWAQECPPGRVNVQHERGDLVDIHPEDDWHWGKAIVGPERLGLWKVVIVPDATLEDVDHLRAGIVDPIEFDRPTYRHRVWRVDLDRLSGDHNTEIWAVKLAHLLDCAAIKPETLLTADIGGPNG